MWMYLLLLAIESYRILLAIVSNHCFQFYVTTPLIPIISSLFSIIIIILNRGSMLFQFNNHYLTILCAEILFNQYFQQEISSSRWPSQSPFIMAHYILMHQVCQFCQKKKKSIDEAYLMGLKDGFYNSLIRILRKTHWFVRMIFTTRWFVIIFRKTHWVVRMSRNWDRSQVSVNPQKNIKDWENKIKKP